MKSPRKVYGVKQVGVKYVERPSVYGIIEGYNKTLAVVDVNDCLFLLGVRKLQDETDELCLEREFLGELGWKIEIGQFLGETLTYLELSHSGFFYRLISRYYHILHFTIISEPIELDHKFSKRLLYLEIYVIVSKIRFKKL